MRWPWTRGHDPIPLVLQWSTLIDGSWILRLNEAIFNLPEEERLPWRNWVSLVLDLFTDTIFCRFSWTSFVDLFESIGEVSIDQFYPDTRWKRSFWQILDGSGSFDGFCICESQSTFQINCPCKHPQIKLLVPFCISVELYHKRTYDVHALHEHVRCEAGFLKC